MRRAPWVAALLLVAASAALGQDLPAPDYVENRPWGQPSRIVPPDYPAAAVAKGLSGAVILSGRIDAVGQYRDVTFEPETPESAAFVQPLREVLNLWRFHPLLGNDCMPKDDRVVTRVWFEVAEGKPKISVSTPAEPKRPPGTFDPLDRPQPSYPQTMLRARGNGAVVFSRQDIQPDGRVASVAMKTFAIGEPAPAKPFEREVERALLDWRWPALPAGETRVRTACYRIVFTLRD